MKRIILMALAGLTLSSGVALADRHHGGGNNRRENRQDRHEVRQDRREVRQDRREVRQDSRDFHRDQRSDNRRWGGDRWGSGNRVVVRNRPSFRNNTWYFSGGVTRTYHRPEMHYHYRNYSSRPTILVENYDPMPGYIWMAGDWSWNGVEWMWAPGHYEIDASYNDYNGYDGY